jgi:hypothetical protein
MRGGDLGRAEMRVVQMCTGVLQDPQRQCCFQWILTEFGGVEVGGDDYAPGTVNRSGREASRRKYADLLTGLAAGS